MRGLKIKLTKRNNIPNLTFEVSLSGANSERQVVHDVPITVSNFNSEIRDTALERECFTSKSQERT